MTTFSDEAWARVSAIRTAIDELPFVTGLADGSLPPDRFTYYLAQDAHYLDAYARVLAACAAQSTDPADLSFWAGGAQRAVAVEQALHASHLAGTTPIEQSPTCLGYSSYLSALAGRGSYAALVAGVLPCFWIYQDVGTRLIGAAAAQPDHPYAAWITTYADPAFAAATEQAKDITDALAAQASERVLEQMHAAFTTASRFELLFWDAAWRAERWPV